MKLRFRPMVCVAMATMIAALTPLHADIPVSARAFVQQARDALAQRQGMTAQARLEQAIASGAPADDVRHLMAHAFLLQGRFDAVRDTARADRVPRQYAGYAARMRAAATADRAVALRELSLAAQFSPSDSLIWSDTARVRLSLGDSGGAIGAADRAVALDPANVDALVLSGTLLRNRYGLAAAMPWYDRALAIDPRHLAAMLERAATLGDLGRARDMLAQTRAVLAAYPNNPQAFYLQAVLAARARDWVLARSLLHRATGPKGDRLGDLPGVRLLAGSIDLAQGNAEQAIVAFRALVLAQPDNLHARRLFGSALHASGDDRAAIEILSGPASRPDADTYTLTLIGRAFERLGDRRLAGIYLDRASQPLRGGSTMLDGSDRRSLGGALSVPWLRQLVRSGRADEAVAIAERFLAGNPGKPAAMLLYGDSLASAGRWRDAASLYRRAANLEFSEETALRLIDALQRNGDRAAALAVLETYRTQNPQSIAAALLASDAALAQQDWDRAAGFLENVRSQIGERDTTLLNNLGWARLGQQRASEAAVLGRAAYALAPASAPVAASYGWFAHAAGDKPTAIAMLEKAVVLAPEIATYRERLARVRRAR
jgi:cellulose synthase operon protein C